MLKAHTAIMASIGEGNLGDEAILDGIIEKIKSENAETEIVIFSHNTSDTERRHPGNTVRPVLPAGIRSFLKQLVNGELRKSLRMLKNVDKVLIGGGGIFYDSKFSQGRNPIKVWATRCKLLNYLKVPYKLNAVGISEFQKEESKKLMLNISNQAQEISVRDAKSKNNLIQIGVEKEIEVVQDPAFNLSCDSNKIEDNFYRIGVSLRKWLDLKSQNEFTNSIASFINQLKKEKKLKVVLIPFSFGVENDTEILTILKEKIDPEIECELLTKDQLNSTDKLLKTISSLDFMLGMRLHSIITSIICQVPFLALAYSEKVQELLKEKGFEERMVLLEEITNINLVERYRKVI